MALAQSRVHPALALIGAGLISVLFLGACGRTEPGPTPVSEPPTAIGPDTTPKASATAAPTPLTADDLSTFSPPLQRPNGMTSVGGQLFVSCSGDGTIYLIDAETGEAASYVYGVANAHTLYAESVGDALHLWVPDYDAGNVKHYTEAGVETLANGLEGPWGIARLSDEAFLVTGQRGDALSLVRRDGEHEVVLEGLDEPTDLVVDASAGLVYVANGSGDDRAVEWYSLDDLRDGEPAPEGGRLVEGLDSPTDIHAAEDGYLYVAYADGDEGLVGRVDAAACHERGGCAAEDVTVVIESGLPAPLAGLTTSPSGRLYLHTAYGEEIYWVQMEGWDAAP